MRYEPIEPVSQKDAEEALVRGDAESLSKVVVAAGLHETEVSWAVRFLLRAAAHASPIVRGNALLSFGHLARRFGELDESTVKPLIDRGLVDSDNYVRGQAFAAADDLEHFLGWTFGRLH